MSISLHLQPVFSIILFSTTWKYQHVLICILWVWMRARRASFLFFRAVCINEHFLLGGLEEHLAWNRLLTQAQSWQNHCIQPLRCTGQHLREQGVGSVFCCKCLEALNPIPMRLWHHLRFWDGTDFWVLAEHWWSSSIGCGSASSKLKIISLTYWVLFFLPAITK